MLRIILKSKIHRASITQTVMDYAGSIGIDASLMQAANILPNEKVQVLNLDNGSRFETYVIEERSGSGTICLYGPAAHLGKTGQRVFIISYCLLDDLKAHLSQPKIVYVDDDNRLKKKAGLNG